MAPQDREGLGGTVAQHGYRAETRGGLHAHAVSTPKLAPAVQRVNNASASAMSRLLALRRAERDEATDRPASSELPQAGGATSALRRAASILTEARHRGALGSPAPAPPDRSVAVTPCRIDRAVHPREVRAIERDGPPRVLSLREATLHSRLAQESLELACEDDRSLRAAGSPNVHEMGSAWWEGDSDLPSDASGEPAPNMRPRTAGAARREAGAADATIAHTTIEVPTVPMSRMREVLAEIEQDAAQRRQQKARNSQRTYSRYRNVPSLDPPHVASRVRSAVSRAAEDWNTPAYARPTRSSSLRQRAPADGPKPWDAPSHLEPPVKQAWPAAGRTTMGPWTGYEGPLMSASVSPPMNRFQVWRRAECRPPVRPGGPTRSARRALKW
ncbi:unnamed protein product [Pedinophyceae sp. YPF-701]|nr:unnamed protein product [Pedinophyceae sp. YPF-701]